MRLSDVAPVVLGCFWPSLYCACVQSASDQNSHIALRFSDADFLKERNNLAIRQSFHAMTFDPIATDFECL